MPLIRARASIQVVALSAICCVWLWNVDSGVRTHSATVELANGAVYEVDVHRVFSPGWRRQVLAWDARCERELLETGIPLDQLRYVRRAAAGASWWTRAKLLLLNSGNTVIWWLDDACDDVRAAYSAWAEDRRMRAAEEDFETIAIDIRRNGKPLPLAGEVGDALFISIKELELLCAQIPGSAVHHGLYTMDDWFHVEFSDGLEMVIIGKYMLHVLDGRVIRIVGGRGRFDAIGCAP